jgi:hypothetical protein
MARPPHPRWDHGNIDVPVETFFWFHQGDQACHKLTDIIPGKQLYPGKRHHHQRQVPLYA